MRTWIMATWQSMGQPHPYDHPYGAPWSLGAAQAQMDAIAAALMPLGWSAAGRLQVPSIEIEETDSALVITAFLPGVDPRAVRVRASARALTFSGQRQSGYRSPLAAGLGLNYFQQTVPLPMPVLDRHMQVAYQAGAIVVTLPKQRPWLQQVFRGWQRARAWLGQTLTAWGRRLLEDR
jgi:HSP20 family molecular chaperone IbpA